MRQARWLRATVVIASLLTTLSRPDMNLGDAYGSEDTSGSIISPDDIAALEDVWINPENSGRGSTTETKGYVLVRGRQDPAADDAKNQTSEAPSASPSFASQPPSLLPSQSMEPSTATTEPLSPSPTDLIEDTTALSDRPSPGPSMEPDLGSSSPMENPSMSPAPALVTQIPTIRPTSPLRTRSPIASSPPPPQSMQPIYMTGITIGLTSFPTLTPGNTFSPTSPTTPRPTMEWERIPPLEFFQMRPTTAPTVRPPFRPTRMPTDQDTLMPTVDPLSDLPSEIPSEIPSSVPSDSPFPTVPPRTRPPISRPTPSPAATPAPAGPTSSTRVDEVVWSLLSAGAVGCLLW